MYAGASFADIGCGYGLSTMIIAQTFPNAQVCGYDIHEPSINEARKLAKKAYLRVDLELIFDNHWVVQSLLCNLRYLDLGT